MPIPSEFFPTLEDTINRLAAEAGLARSGRDDGLVPSYSLLGDLRELCSLEAALRGPISELHVAFEHQLDAAKPFDDELLGRLIALVTWLPLAIDCLKRRQVIPPLLKLVPSE